MIVNRSMYPLQQGFAGISRLQQQMGDLQTQLSTGKMSSTLAGMGGDRTMSLSLRARLSGLDAYAAGADIVTLRLNVLDKAMSRLDTIEADARTATTPGNYGSDGLNLTSAPALAEARLDEVVTLLNTEVSGRYLMAGAKTETAPVASKAAILDGENGRAGFRTVAGQRKLADLGTDGRGRVTVGIAGAAVSLAEDGSHPFGFKLSALSTTSAAVSLTQPAGTPRSSAIAFSGQPTAGESISIGLTLPDGTSQTLTLTATAGTPKEGEFAIGATPADTATNFKAALGTQLETAGKSTLAAASTFAATENFFNASGQPVQRVNGPPYETSTGLITATATNTVLWYTGASTGVDARKSVTAKIDDSTRVEYGVQGNEVGLVSLVRTLAVGAISTYPKDDASAKDRFDAVASRTIDRLAESNNQQPGSIEAIAMQLGVAQSTIGNVAERHTAFKGQLEELLGSTEDVSVEDVAMKLLALKTRLEATYATTSAVSQISLVNYLK